MPRARTITASQALFVGPTPASGGHFQATTGAFPKMLQDSTTGLNIRNLVKELLRVQSANYSFNFDQSPVNQFGELAAIDYVAANPPTVSLDFSYLLSNMNNEKNMGFAISSGTLLGCLSGILKKESDDKNYFIGVVSEGEDAHQTTNTTDYTVGIGNGYITNYSLNAQVGQFPTVSVTVEGLNMNVLASSSGLVPAINQFSGTPITNSFFKLPITGSSTSISGLTTNSSALAISTLKPQDVTFSLGYADLGASVADWKVQSVNLSIPLSRESLNQLGSRYSFSKELTFPINATMTVTALQGDMVTGNLNALFEGCSTSTYDATLTFKYPCFGQTTIAAYICRGAKLSSHQYSSSIGQNNQVTMNFTIPVGGPQSSTSNIFFSGAVAY